MRTLAHISDERDIYLPVDKSDIQAVEEELNFKLPQALADLYARPSLELIRQLPALLWPVRHASIGIVNVNRALQALAADPYPAFLVAFATNECGDYWVLNTKRDVIQYMDPDKSITENLEADELSFSTFPVWLEVQLAKRTG